MEPILKIKLGQEYKAHIDDVSDFERSIFSQLYQRSLNHIADIIKQSEDEGDQGNPEKYNNIIAFTGERGTGKTSAMSSFVNSLKETSYKELEGKKKVYKFALMETIDPSLFRKNDRLFEIIVTRMFAKFQDSINNQLPGKIISQEDKRRLIDTFQKVYKDLKILNQEKKDIYDKEVIEALSDLAYGTNLKNKFQELVGVYLEVMENNSDFLVIPVDDFDLNLEGAYDMLEDIRQFLIQNRLIIFIACKIEQLKDALREEIVKKTKNLFNDDVFKFEGFYTEDKPNEKAERYLEKLIPLDRRLYTDSLGVENKCRVQVFDNDNLLYDENSVERLIIKLIYSKFNFFLPILGSSRNYFIGNTLRQLIHQIILIQNSTSINQYVTYVSKQKNEYLTGEDIVVFDLVKQESQNRNEYYLELFESKLDSSNTSSEIGPFNQVVSFSDVLEAYYRLGNQTRLIDFHTKKASSFLALNYSLSNLISYHADESSRKLFIHNYHHRGTSKNEIREEGNLQDLTHLSGFREFMENIENENDFQFMLCFVAILGNEATITRKVVERNIGYGNKRFDNIGFNPNNFIGTLYSRQIMFLDENGIIPEGKTLSKEITNWKFDGMECFSNVFFVQLFSNYYETAIERIRKDKNLTGSMSSQLKYRLIEGYRRALMMILDHYKYLNFDVDQFMNNPIFKYWQENEARVNLLLDELFARKAVNINLLAQRMLKDYSSYFNQEFTSNRGAKQGMNFMIKNFEGIKSVHDELKELRREMDHNLNYGLELIENKLRELSSNG